MNLTKSHALLILASLGFSFILIFSTLLKESGISSLQQVFSRITISLPLLLILTAGKIKLKKKDITYFAATGLTFSAFLLSALSSIALGCPVPVTVALIYTQPFFTAIIAYLTKKEKITLQKLAIVITGMLGAFLASGITTPSELSLNLGILPALLGGFLYAVYLYLKRTQKKDYTPLQALFNTFLFATPITLLLGLTITAFTENPLLTSFTIPDSYQLSLLTSFAIFSTVLPYGLLNYVKTGEVSPITEGTLLLLDPALHVVWATTILKQYVTPLQYLGITLVLSSTILMLKIKGKT